MRKNILILGHSYYGPQFVDINNQYAALFDPAQYDVTVAYLIGAPNKDIEKKHTANQVIFFNLSRKSIRYLKFALILKVLTLCRQKKFEVVICHRYKATYSLLWTALFCKIPALFFVMHELGTVTPLTRRLTIALLAQKNMIFAGVSNAVRNDIQKHIWRVKPQRVITLHNMIDIPQTESQLYDRSHARNKLGISQASFIFGNVGRLAVNKDQRTLIHAFSTIKNVCPQAQLLIAGDGRLETELKKYVSDLQLSNEVIFTGYLNDAFRYMKAFDVFILSSIQEAFGMVLLEAMTSKIPIIATRVNGIPEVIGDTCGSLVPSANAQALAAEMLKSYNMSQLEREKIALHGYERVTTHFSLQICKEIFWSLPIMIPLKAQL